MEDTLISSSGRGQCPRSLSPSSTDEVRISVDSSGEVNFRRGDGVTSEEQGCHRSESPINACAKIKHEAAVRKQRKQHMQKRLQECETQSGKERKSYASAALPEEPAHFIIVDEPEVALTSEPVAITGGKEHAIDEDESDTEEEYASTEDTLSDLWDDPSYDFPLPDDTSSHDVNREISGYLQSGSQDSASFLTPRNRVESFMAHFLNNQITLGPGNINFCTQTEDLIKFLQILDFIKTCDGAIYLLWNFMRKQTELLSRQEVSVLLNTDDGENNQENREEEELCSSDLVLDLSDDEVDEMDYQEPTEVEYLIEGDISEESVEVSGEDRGSCIGVSEDGSTEEGHKEVAKHFDNDLHLNTGTYGDGSYPHEEITDDPSEQDDCDCLHDVSGTRSKEEFRGQFYLGSSSDLSELISNFALSNTSLLESDDNDDGNSPLLYEGIGVQMASVGMQTEDLVSCEEYSSASQTYCNKKIQVDLRKQRRPYSIPVMTRQRKRSGRYNMYPYKGMTYRYRPCVKEEKFVLCPKEECDGENSYTDCCSDVSSEHDTHCHGGVCYINEESYDDEKYQHRLEDNLKWGDTGGLKDTLSCVMGPGEDMRTGLTGISTEAENVSDARTELKKYDNIPVIDTSPETVSGCLLSPNTDLTNEDEMFLVTGDVERGVILYQGVKKKVLDSTLMNDEVNESNRVKLEEEEKQETGKQECPVWQILKHSECPFKWVPDIFISRSPNSVIQENIITHLAGKEKEFSQIKCSVFREVVIYLVLVYEKTLEDRFMEAIVDLQHCYTLLGNSQTITSCTETSNEKLDVNLVKGNYHFNEIKCRRTNLYHGDGMSYDEDDKMLNILKPQKHTVMGQCGSPNAELLVPCSKAEMSDQAGVQKIVPHSCGSVSGRNDISMGSFDLDVKCVNHDGHKNQVMDCKSCSINDKENMYDPELINGVLVSNESEEENEEKLNNYKLQADVVQETEYDNNAIKGSKKEKPAGQESETERQEQRRAALEYVVNATLAHVAYFSESSHEAYNLAKHIENKYEQLGSAGKATVAALRGAMLFEYGYTGNKLGLQFLQKALELDPEHWEWNLYCGKVMSRIRQVEKFKGGPPGQEEVSLLEKAAQLHRDDASVLVHLANVYRGLSYFRYIEKMETEAKADSVIETRHYVHNGGSANWRGNWSQAGHSQHQEENMNPLERWRNPQQIPMPRPVIPLEANQKDYLQLAKGLFLEALRIEPHCPYNNARCAKGLWSMPVPYKDKECAKEAILHALTMAPDDSLVNHYAGLFYEYCHDFEKALICYKRATRDSNINYPAEMNYISLKMKMSPPGSYSPLFCLDKLVSKYSSPNYIVQILCHRGFYLYMMEKQYFQAIRNLSRAIKTDPGNETLKMFCPWKFYGRDISYNIYDLLEKMTAEYKELPHGSVDEDFVEETLETVRRLREKNC